MWTLPGAIIHLPRVPPGQGGQTQKQDRGDGDCPEKDLFSPRTHWNDWRRWGMKLTQPVSGVA